VNGGTSFDDVLGICVAIEARPLAGAKKARDVPASR
jgi:hypothetical protein